MNLSGSESLGCIICRGLRYPRQVNCFHPLLLPTDVPRTRFFSWGFVCVDISSRNHVHGSTNRAENVVESGTGLTGGTWKGGLDYLVPGGVESGIAENVKNLAATPTIGPTSDPKDERDKDSKELQTLLDTCQIDLAEKGYSSVAVLASPHECTLPQSRWRALIAFSKKLSLARLERVAAKFEEIKSTGVPFELDNCLLDPQDELVDGELHRLLAIKAESVQKNQSDAAAEKWKKRDNRSKNSGPPSKYADRKLAMQLPWLDTLTVREHAALLGSKPARVADVAQHGERTTLSGNLDITPCVTKKVEFWDTLFDRKHLPLEKCLLQGIVLSRWQYNKSDPSFLNRLTGNAYNGPLLLILTLLIWIAEAELDHELHLESLRRAPQAQVATSPPSSEPQIPPTASVDLAEWAEDFGSLAL